jgi:hypothetical protein
MFQVPIPDFVTYIVADGVKSIFAIDHGVVDGHQSAREAVASHPNGDRLCTAWGADVEIQLDGVELVKFSHGVGQTPNPKSLLKFGDVTVPRGR